MDDATKLPDQVDFFFEYDPAYRLVAANGIWGGFTTRGDLRLDFFVESQAIPERVTNRVTPDGKIGAEVSRNPEKRLIRRVQVGVLLSPDQAESVAELIKGRVADFRAKKAKIEGEEKNV